MLAVKDFKNVRHGVMFDVGVEERYLRLYAEEYGAINPHRPDAIDAHG